MNSEEEQTVVNEKFQKKLNQLTKYQSEETINLTKRLAILGLAWNSTNAKNILNAIAFTLENPHELKEIKIYKSNFGKKNLETADKEELKDCYFAIATFSTLDCALEAYNNCNTLDFPDENSFFTFKVVPDDKIFTDLHVDEAKIEDLQIFTKKKQNHKNLTNEKVKRIKEESEESVDERFKEVIEDDDFLIDENHTSFKKKK